LAANTNPSPREPDVNAEREERSGFPAALIAGVIVMALVVAGFILLTRIARSHTPSGSDKLPFDSAAQAYAPKIHFLGLQLSQSSNLLNQQFVYVAGTMSNDGDRTVRAMEVTVEFHDSFNQVILRDTQRLVGPATDPLSVGQMRDFQVTIVENLSSEWNHQDPSIRVAGLVLE
jgi:hypothetical protein